MSFAICVASVNGAYHFEDDKIIPPDLEGRKIIVDRIMINEGRERKTFTIFLKGGEELVFSNKESTFFPEGSSANIAKVLASVFGKEVSVYAPVGRDIMADAIAGSLSESNINFHPLPRQQTAVTVSVRNKLGVTTLFCQKPPNRKIDVSSVVSAIRREKPEIVFATSVRPADFGLVLECFKRLPADTTKALIPHYDLLSSNRPRLSSIYPFVDFLQVNEREGKALLNIPMDENINPQKHLEGVKDHIAMNGRANNVFVLTLGSRGAAYVTFAGKKRSHVVECNPVEVEAVDSTGSGDTFFATLGVGLLLNMSHTKATRMASFAAAQNARHVGGHAIAHNLSGEEIFASVT